MTNSLWDYTHVVMNFLCEGRTGAAKNLDWIKRFDVVRYLIRVFDKGR